MSEINGKRGVLARAFDILGCFTGGEPERSVADICAVTDLPPATVHRMLATLSEHGAIERTGRGRYRLGPRLWRLGHGVPDIRLLRDCARPALVDLHASTRLPVALVTREGDRLHIIDKIAGRNTVRVWEQSRIAGTGRAPRGPGPPGLGTRSGPPARVAPVAQRGTVRLAADARPGPADRLRALSHRRTAHLPAGLGGRARLRRGPDGEHLRDDRRSPGPAPAGVTGPPGPDHRPGHLRRPARQPGGARARQNARLKGRAPAPPRPPGRSTSSPGRSAGDVGDTAGGPGHPVSRRTVAVGAARRAGGRGTAGRHVGRAPHRRMPGRAREHAPVGSLGPGRPHGHSRNEPIDHGLYRRGLRARGQGDRPPPGSRFLLHDQPPVTAPTAAPPRPAAGDRAYGRPSTTGHR
ncbi:hypothetical protein SHIRM173S_07294 [Streptomyces hirsutus]